MVQTKISWDKIRATSPICAQRKTGWGMWLCVINGRLMLVAMFCNL